MNERTVLTRAQIEEIKQARREGVGWRPLEKKYHISGERARRLAGHIKAEKPGSLNNKRVPRETVMQIRVEWAAAPYSMKIQDFGMKYGLTADQVSGILNFSTYKDVGGPRVDRSAFPAIREKVCWNGHDKTKYPALPDGQCRRCRTEQKKRYEQKQLAGRKPGSSNLSMAQIVEIRESFAAGELPSSIGARIGFSRYTVSQVAHGRRYPDAPGPITPALSEEMKAKVLAIRNEYRRHPREIVMEQLAQEHGLSVRQARRIVNGESYKDVGGPITKDADVKKIRERLCKNGHRKDDMPRRKDGNCVRCRREQSKKYDKNTRRGKRSHKKTRQAA